MEIHMSLPGWMKIGEKSVGELLLIWGLPLLFVLGAAFAVWGTFADGGDGLRNLNSFNQRGLSR